MTLCRLCLLCALCIAGTAGATEVQVKNPWARGATVGQASAPAYFDLYSDTPLKLVAASSPWARQVEIRTVQIKDGLPVERVVPTLEVPAGELRFAPGGSYLALLGVQRAFANGDYVPMTLRFEDARGVPHMVELKAQVRGLLLTKPASPQP